MQAVDVQPPLTSFARPEPGTASPAGVLSPEGMARHLRRTGGDAALCFALAIYEDAAWANEAWRAFWADVVRLV